MNINNYDEYILDMIVESINNNEIKLFLSFRLKELIKYIVINYKNNIAKHILDTIDNDFKSKISYIDLDDSGIDMVSFITIPKAIEVISNFSSYNNIEITNDIFNKFNIDNGPLYTKNRTKIKIGKLITKLYGDKFKASGEPNNDIESFVNIFKSLRDTGKFELVSGSDIVYWYNEDQYVKGNGRLNGSCMKYNETQKYIEFYAQNPKSVSLLILKDKLDDDKIRGRAIVWNLYNPSGRTFMDRIYTVLDSDIELFKNYAKEHGWLYKYIQNFNENEYIVDPIDDTSINRLLIVNDMKQTDYFPFLDTLKCYNPYTYELTNDSDYYDGEGYYYLENTRGGYEGCNGENDSEMVEDHEGETYVDFYDEWIDDDDLIYCEKPGEYRLNTDCFYSDYYECMIANSYADNDMIWCIYGEEYREPDDAIKLTKYDEYATKEYLDNSDEFIYIQNTDVWIKIDDSVYSKNYGDNLDKDYAIEVYTDSDGYDTDWRINGDDTYFKHTDDKYYDNSVTFDDED